MKIICLQCGQADHHWSEKVKPDVTRCYGCGVYITTRDIKKGEEIWVYV